MVLAACILTFLSVGFLVLWMTAGHDRSARRRVERELLLRTSGDPDSAGGVDDATLLKDDSLSGFRGIDSFLNSLSLAANMRRLLEQADLKMKVGTLLTMMLSAGVVGALAAHTMHLGLMLAVTIGFLAGSMPYTWVLVRRRRRIRAFETQFPEAVDLISRAIRAGHALSTGIKMVADEMPDPVGKEFRRIFEEQNLGLPLRNALTGLLERVELVDLKLFVVAILIQRQSGGNLSEVLDKIAYTIRERFRILRQLKVHTAQARLTGMILVALPPVVGTIIYTLNYEYIKIIFTDTWGVRILVCAALLQLMGFLWIRKIVNIEV